MPAVPATAAPHDEIESLLRAGAPRLALRVVDLEQPAVTGDLHGWLAWERERLAVLHGLADWDALLARLATHPQDLPPEFRDWTLTLHAEAAIGRGDGATARSQLLRLLWQRAGSAPPEAFAEWRRLVIRSYLAEDLLEDAYLAMVRYRFDHGSDDPAFRELPARVLLRSGRPADALAALGAAAGPTAEALRLLATLLARREPPAEVLATASTAATKQAANPDPLVATRFWTVAAAAAAAAEQPAARIAALEAGLPARDPGEAERLLAPPPDTLWDAYRELGQQLGNRAQLLVGQDAAWLELAGQLAAQDPLAARALHATLAQTSLRPETRQQAHDRFARLLAAEPRGAALLQRLYLDSPRFADLATVPEAVRHLLAERALADGDLRLASRLLAGLDAPPDTADGFAWRLRRVRVLVLGGDPARGALELGRLVEADPVATTAQFERVLQVVFDLQTVGEHAAAIALLERLGPLAADDRQRRELPFWVADSHRAAGRPLEAARAYLRSATLLDPFALDEWAQSARYQAAKSLAAAGLVADARNLLQMLLNATRDPGRRATLQRDLQQLWLLE